MVAGMGFEPTSHTSVFTCGSLGLTRVMFLTPPVFYHLQKGIVSFFVPAFYAEATSDHVVVSDNVCVHLCSPLCCPF